MTEIERIKERIAAIAAEQQQAQVNWHRCDGALQVLRHMLGEAMRQEDQAVPETVTVRMNGELPAPAGE